MSGHDLRVDYAWPTVRGRCTCGEWSLERQIAGEAGALNKGHAVHAAAAEQAEADRIAREQSNWYARTGHCAACGQPGEWCLCTAPCGCAHLHPVGSGIGRDPAVVYADTKAEQDGLFE